MAEIETGKRDASLNVVPFIDLMSTLTAFLLVAAVWTHQAASPIKGRARDAGQNSVDELCFGTVLSVLVTADAVFVGESRTAGRWAIPKVGGAYDWAGLARILNERRRAEPWMVDETWLDLAVESTTAHPVAYQELIAASDVVLQAGFTDAVVVGPGQLSASAIYAR